MRLRAKMAILGAVVLVAAVVVIVIRKPRSPEEEGSTSKTVEVCRGPIVVKLKETGVITPLEVVEVKSGVSGRIAKFYAEEGDSVRRDELLALVEPDFSQALSLAQKRTAVEQRRIELLEAERDLNLKEELFQSRLISENEMEDARNAFELSRSAYELDSLQLAILENETNPGGRTLPKGGLTSISDFRVVSPVDGVVLERRVQPGEFIVAGTSGLSAGGTVIMRVADLSDLVVRIDVSEIDVPKVNVGQSVEVKLSAEPDQIHEGRVKRVAPEGRTERDVVVFPTQVELPQPDSILRPGMTCDADIIVAQKDSVLLVPTTALFTEGDSTFVTLVEEGKQRPQAVTVGLRSETDAEISSGLEEGEKVLCHPKPHPQSVRKKMEDYW